MTYTIQPLNYKIILHSIILPQYRHKKLDVDSHTVPLQLPLNSGKGSWDLLSKELVPLHYHLCEWQKRWLISMTGQ